MLKDNNNWLELMAQKLAEVRLSEVGFRFVHGIYPAWKRVKQVVESKAHIIRDNSLSPEDTVMNNILNRVKGFEERSHKNAKNSTL
ncbi:MAG: hypothetical protein JW991_03815 [Candidatus Pacebacteria bacterium]|nr:hypothetical protein [Candidatus Paceibacterota bacterium]